jgi:hypothetical protein
MAQANPEGIYRADGTVTCSLCHQPDGGYAMHVSPCGCGAPNQNPTHLVCVASDLLVRFGTGAVDGARTCAFCGAPVFTQAESVRLYARITLANDSGILTPAVDDTDPDYYRDPNPPDPNTGERNPHFDPRNAYDIATTLLTGAIGWSGGIDPASFQERIDNEAAAERANTAHFAQQAANQVNNPPNAPQQQQPPNPHQQQQSQEEKEREEKEEEEREEEEREEKEREEKEQHHH